MLWISTTMNMSNKNFDNGSCPENDASTISSFLAERNGMMGGLCVIQVKLNNPFMDYLLHILKYSNFVQRKEENNNLSAALW